MIYRTIKFEVAYDVGPVGVPDWRREPVTELLSVPQFGVTSITTASGVELPFDPLKMSLLQSTGLFDKYGFEIFHAHILANEISGEIYQVMYANGSFFLAKNEERIEMTDEVCSKLKIIGDALKDEKLLMPEKPVDQLVKESKDRKILPPVISLKKKTQ